MKILVLNDIHLGSDRFDSKRQLRGVGSLALGALPSMIDSLMIEHSPDVLIQMGDLIQARSFEEDLQDYRKGIETFHHAACPVIHLLGNHDRKFLSIQDIEKIWKDEGFEQPSYGSKDFGALRIGWLGLEPDPENPRCSFLPKEQMVWLKEQLSHHASPLLLFTHYPLDMHELTGNYFVEDMEHVDDRVMFHTNSKDIRALLSAETPLRGVFQAHCHDFYLKLEGTIPFFTLPAMNDLLLGPLKEGLSPMTYTLISTTSKQISVKSYSGKFLFAGCELPMTP